MYYLSLCCKELAYLKEKTSVGKTEEKDLNWEDLEDKKGPNNREFLDMRLRNMDFIELVMGSGWRFESENNRRKKHFKKMSEAQHAKWTGEETRAMSWEDLPL